MNFKEYLENKKFFFLGLLLSFKVAFLDLLTKRLTFVYLDNTDLAAVTSNNNYIQVTSFFNLVNVWNHGVSFGMFSNFAYSQLLFSVIVATIIVVMLVWLYRTKKLHLTIAIAFIIGGAVGNLYDRIKYGAVADFLDFHAFGYHWPAFNLADSFVFIGVAILLIDDFFFKKN